MATVLSATNQNNNDSVWSTIPAQQIAIASTPATHTPSSSDPHPPVLSRFSSSQVCSQTLPSLSPISPHFEPTAPYNGPNPMVQPNLNPPREPTAQPQNESLTQAQLQSQEINQSPHQASPIDSPLSELNSQNPPPILQSQNQNSHKMTTRAKNNIHKPKRIFSLSVTGPDLSQATPHTIFQALKNKTWSEAATKEINALIGNHTWDLVLASVGQNLVRCRWIFTIKHHADDTIDRFKARIVAKGYTQQYGVDYKEAFSPVIKATTIRLVLSIAMTKSWKIMQLDVNNAFLQGDLTEEIYMSQPPGFISKDHPHHVCRLRKPIYGLKQAPRSWYISLKTYLLNAGFTSSLADASLFVMSTPTAITYVLVYVDDIIVTGSSNTVVDLVLNSLSNRFSIKDPTNLHYFLGIEVTTTSRGIHLMQRKYIQDLLLKYNMFNAKPVSTPLSSSTKLHIHEGTLLQDPSQFRSLVGSLQYLSFTRPDLAFVVNRLSQFMHKPTDLHWAAVKRVLRYLVSTASHGIQFHKNSPNSLYAYSDADWAGNIDDFVSTNGYITYHGKNPVSWSSRKQRGVARSSTEAEYRAVANTAAELSWIRSLLTELRHNVSAQPVIYCDNIGATYLCANPVFHSRMKHIALDYHFVRDRIQQGTLRVAYVSTHDQLADTLTKPLPRSRFNTACHKIGVFEKPPP